MSMVITCLGDLPIGSLSRLRRKLTPVLLRQTGILSRKHPSEEAARLNQIFERNLFSQTERARL